MVPPPPALRRQEPPPIPVAVSAFQVAIDNMGRRVHNKGIFLYCARCRKRRKIGNHKYWTSTPCSGVLPLRRACPGDDEPPAKALQTGSRQIEGMDEDEDDPFGYARLGLDDAADAEPIAAPAHVAPEATPIHMRHEGNRMTSESKPLATVGEARDGREMPSAGPTPAVLRFEGLRMRVIGPMNGRQLRMDLEWPVRLHHLLSPTCLCGESALQHGVDMQRPDMTSL